MSLLLTLPSYSNNFIFPDNLSLFQEETSVPGLGPTLPPSAPGVLSCLPESRRPFEKWHWVPLVTGILLSCGDARGPPAGHRGGWRAGPWLSEVGQLSGDPGGASETWLRPLSPSTPFPQAPEASPVLPGMDGRHWLNQFSRVTGNFLGLPWTPPLTPFHVFFPPSASVITTV